MSTPTASANQTGELCGESAGKGRGGAVGVGVGVGVSVGVAVTVGVGDGHAGWPGCPHSSQLPATQDRAGLEHWSPVQHGSPRPPQNLQVPP
jgi:hypothetical protein